MDSSNQDADTGRASALRDTGMRKDQPDIDMSPEIRELWESEGRFRVYAGELLAEFIGSFPETLSSYSEEYPTPWGRVRFTAAREDGRRIYRLRRSGF